MTDTRKVLLIFAEDAPLYKASPLTASAPTTGANVYVLVTV